MQHLRPTATIAPDAILPGDPGRALALAQDLLSAPLMSNHHRGLWGYYGETARGRQLTIQSTGIGGPSGAVVLHELAELGVARAIRVGTCSATSHGPPVGTLLAVDEALAGDGTSNGLGATGFVPASPGLTAALAEAAGARRGRVATVDLYYGRAHAPADAGAEVVDLATAPLFALARRLDVEIAAILVVVGGPGVDTGPAEELEAAELAMGRAAGEALALAGEAG